MIDFSNPAEIFRLLEQGVADAEHPLHLVALATIGPGGYPECRSVILRQADLALRSLRVYADVRSPKVAQAQADPRVTLLGYDPVTRLQIRCRATAKTHVEDDIAHAAWLALPATSRSMYAALESPGQAVSAHPSMPIPSEIADPVAFRHFAVIACYVTEIDVLELSRRQNRRSILRWTEAGWEEVKVAC